MVSLIQHVPNGKQCNNNRTRKKKPWVLYFQRVNVYTPHINHVLHVPFQTSADSKLPCILVHVVKIPLTLAVGNHKRVCSSPSAPTDFQNHKPIHNKIFIVCMFICIVKLWLRLIKILPEIWKGKGWQQWHDNSTTKTNKQLHQSLYKKVIIKK